MDRETIAYLLIVVMAIAIVTAMMFAFHNTPKRKYKRLMKREHALRRELQAKHRLG